MSSYSGSSYGHSDALASKRAEMARAAAKARQMRLWKEAATAAARLAAADRTRQEGDIRVASGIYLSVALKQKATPTGQQAKQRLAELAAEARERCHQIDTRLINLEDPHRPIDAPPGEHWLPLEPPPSESQDTIAEAFRQYSDLADQYELVPVVARELRRHIARQRRRPEYAAALNEPEAKALWEAGQQHERKGEACCAYWVYESSARLVPAPSALKSRDRMAEMKRDPEVVSSAETCKCIRECHKIYLQAERLIELRPLIAKERFAAIVDRAPDDSEVYRLAKQRLASM